MNRLYVFILIALYSFSGQLHGQNFKGYLVVGSNIAKDKFTETGKSQIGSRIGLNVGAGGLLMLNKRLNLGMELLYSQNAVYVNPNSFPPVLLDRIRLHYAEVPLSLNYRFQSKNNPKEYFHSGMLSGGAAVAHLFHHYIIDVEDNNVSEDAQFSQRNALLFHLGATAFIKENIAINAKASISYFREPTFSLRALFFI